MQYWKSKENRFVEVKLSKRQTNKEKWKKFFDRILKNGKRSASDLPFIAIGANELDNQPDIPKEYDCPRCGNIHPVEYGDRVEKDGTKVPDTMLAFVQCHKKTYLIGMNGKMMKQFEIVVDF